MSAQKFTEGPSGDLLRIIIEEVDEAREVLEVVQQLVHALPLRSFEDLIQAVGEDGAIKFRGRAFEINQFAQMVPATFFPIEDKQTLVALMYQAVRMAPRTIQYDESDPSNAKRRLRRLGLMGLPTGLLGPTPGPALMGQGGPRHTQKNAGEV